MHFRNKSDYYLIINYYLNLFKSCARIKVTSTTDITRSSTGIRIEPVVSCMTYIDIRNYYIFPVSVFFVVFLILYFEGWAQDCSNSNIFLKPLFRGNFDPFVNSANLGVIAHTSNGT